jgi:hypothetical protein
MVQVALPLETSRIYHQDDQHVWIPRRENGWLRFLYKRRTRNIPISLRTVHFSLLLFHNLQYDLKFQNSEMVQVALPLLQICDHNVVYEIRLRDALKAELLAPFHYFGISDHTVDPNKNFGVK